MSFLSNELFGRLIPSQSVILNEVKNLFCLCYTRDDFNVNYFMLFAVMKFHKTICESSIWVKKYLIFFTLAVGFDKG
jgi:hypothetical protein